VTLDLPGPRIRTLVRHEGDEIIIWLRRHLRGNRPGETTSRLPDRRLLSREITPKTCEFPPCAPGRDEAKGPPRRQADSPGIGLAVTHRRHKTARVHCVRRSCRDCGGTWARLAGQRGRTFVKRNCAPAAFDKAVFARACTPAAPFRSTCPASVVFAPDASSALTVGCAKRPRPGA